MNNIKYTLRQILKQRIPAVLNILGLAIGISSAMMLFRVIQFHESFEKSQVKASRIYRIVTTTRRETDISQTTGVAFPFEKAIKLAVPQVEKITTIFQPYQTQITVTEGEKGGAPKMFKEASSVTYVQPSFFEIFNTVWLTGNYKSLADPTSAALSRAYAIKCFGQWQSAIGKTIRINNRKIYTIRGVIADALPNTDFQEQVLLAYSSLDEAKSTNWGSVYSNNMSFLLLAPAIQPATINRLLKQYVHKHLGLLDSPPEYRLQPLTEMHYSTEFSTVSVDPISRSILLSLLFLGVFLILIAAINYVNLSTATALDRAKEIGVRKVLGCRRWQIVFNYLAEALLITAFSGLIAFAICQIFFPQVRTLLGLPDSLEFLTIQMSGLFLLIILGATLLSGLYPALILSGFNPIEAIKAQYISPGSGKIFLRRGLVGMQFLISQILIICTLIGINQVDFFSHSNLGFTKEVIVGLPIPGDSIGYSRTSQLRNELGGINGVKSLSFSNCAILSGSDYETSFTLKGSSRKFKFPINLKFGDASFFSTYGLKFIAGHGYKQSDTISQLVINETLAHRLGFKNVADAIGRNISIDMNPGKSIVGVVADYHNRPLKSAIAPILMACNLKSYQYLGIKLTGTDLKSQLDVISRIWKRIYPQDVYEYTFLDKDIASNYEQEQRLANLFKIFAAISIFIGCLGLYGLVSFMAVQKTKEIGIRKVLGASIGQILQLFSTEFLVLVFTAFLFAVPLAWYLMSLWLENFTYHIAISWYYFAISGLFTLILAFATITSKGLQAARANPIKNLRIE